MSNFKIGEKIVCIGTFYSKNPIDNISAIDPKINEIVTVDYYYNSNEIVLKEYKYSNVNLLQTFNPLKFRKLDHAFGEKICAEILESIKVDELQYN